MKHIFGNQKKLSAAFVLTAVVASAMAVGMGQPTVNSRWSAVEEDTVPFRRYLPGEIRDTAVYAAEREAMQHMKQSTQFNIRLLTRCYGDSVVLRWLAPDYVGWRYLNSVGVTIVRRELDGGESVTLAEALKPTSLEEAWRIYPESDSVARMGIGSIYNKKQANPYNQKDPAGEMGSIYGVHEDQQMQFGFAMLAAEWRADVATHMAVRFTDLDVKRGHKYEYIVMPAVNDTTGNILLVPALAEVENKFYKPEDYDVEVNDSVTGPGSVLLSWPDGNYSSFEIERRQVSPANGQWLRVNQKPYMVMMQGDVSNCIYVDKAVEEGTYEYRVMAHDAFGDLTAPTKPITVTMPDLTPPTPPLITGINLGGEIDGESWADIRWRKDQIEDDLVGYVVFYRHPRITKDEWWKLSKDYVPPTDTICRVNISSLMSGDVMVAAYDKAGNAGKSIAQVMRISDVTPPSPPTGLKAKINLEHGLIKLTWHPNPELDIDHYVVQFANDSTHNFVGKTNNTQVDTCHIDTVFMDANQKYIYYKVVAVDATGNESQPSDMLQVVRPSKVPPQVAHIDSAYVNEQGVYMRWVCSDERQVYRHRVLRRQKGNKDWTVIRVCDADSVKAAGDYIELIDMPDANLQKEWIYAVESFNYFGISSGLSLQYHALFRGKLFFDCKLQLLGSYKNDETRLVWEMGQKPPYEGDWYYSIYRQGPDDESPQFLMTAEQDAVEHTDHLLKPGQQATYYIYVCYPDGRRSKLSNMVTVSAPASK